ncbi:lipase family protein [Chitinophaga barathri]|uniref:Lipase family protein n=1 Tax=Chitinophaga barathri TaxID=1647451 RepID=A0A3N4MCR2_9BACT|nr:lipase family protein [Chitinophaga barathri]RPD41712.1 lipase family protein [Chitinophaga barathri]
MNVKPNLNGQPALAKTAVLLCAVSYATDPVTQIGTYLNGWTVVWNGAQSDDGNYAFIATDPDNEYYAVAIRGSLPPFEVFKEWAAFANWVLEDLDVITRVNWPYVASGSALISSGANRAFNNILDMTDTLGSGLSIDDYLSQNAVKNNKQVIVTGHSLGGNCANVYASYFVTSLAQAGSTFSNISLFTFAAPSAGDSGFATDLDNKLPDAWHYENDNDIVPKFPVTDTVFLVAWLYITAPSAGAITVTYKGHTISLREAFILLSGILYAYGYQQQSLHYSVFGTQVNPDYVQNTFSDWFQQAGAQHALVNYANDLGQKLPAELAEASSPV